MLFFCVACLNLALLAYIALQFFGSLLFWFSILQYWLVLYTALHFWADFNFSWFESDLSTASKILYWIAISWQFVIFHPGLLAWILYCIILHFLICWNSQILFTMSDHGWLEFYAAFQFTVSLFRENLFVFYQQSLTSWQHIVLLAGILYCFEFLTALK